ncbi:cystathionine gamma-lyase [Nannochloropsis oceanica]
MSNGDGKKQVLTDPFRGFGTIAIHAGQEPDPGTGAVVPAISLATTFAQASPGTKYGTDLPNSFGKGFEYSRTGNPTRGAFERAMAAVEHGKHALAFASGLAATSAVVHLLETGQHVVIVDDVYGGTQRYFRKIAKPTYNIDFSFVDFNDTTALEAAFRPNQTKLIWLETPTNPTLKLSDIAATAAIAKKHGALFVVDNTFLSPYFQNPLDLGADMVVHSVTKYIGGHSDVVGGVIITNSPDLNEKLRFIQNSVGAVPSPFDCFMALRGLKTLHVRLEAAARNALAIATYLGQHSGVTKVLFPGLPSHPQFELAKKQQHGPGAMVTFYVGGEVSNARRFLESLQVFILAESLGAVESLAESPAIMTHASVPPEVRKALGIDDTLVRLSVGIESLPDLIEDLDQALNKAAAVTA